MLTSVWESSAHPEARMLRLPCCLRPSLGGFEGQKRLAGGFERGLRHPSWFRFAEGFESPENDAPR